MSCRTLFIVNPAAGAGRGNGRWEALARSLDQEGFQGDRILTSARGDAARRACEAAADYDVIVAVGGDGTAHEVASGLLASKTQRAAFGVIPLGTGNDVASALGVTDQAAGRAVLKRGETRTLDVIEIQCRIQGKPAVRHALLFAAVGIATEALHQTTPVVKRIFGQKLAYPVGVLRAVWHHRPQSIRVTCDGRSFEQPFLLVAANNSEQIGGGMKLAPGARMDDGELNVNLVDAVGWWQVLMQLSRACRGTHTTHPGVRYFPARTMAIETEPPIEVAADGDVIGETPARLEVKPKALRVVAAPTAAL